MNKFPIFFLIISILILLTPILFTRIALNDIFDFSDTGEIGDTIGGITTPFINLFAAWLVYKSFMAQVKANKKIQTQIEFNKLEFENNTKQRNFESALIMYNLLLKDINEFNVDSIDSDGNTNFKRFLSDYYNSEKDANENAFLKYKNELQIFSGINISFSILCKAIYTEKYNKLEREILSIRMTNIYNSSFKEIIDNALSDSNADNGFKKELILLYKEYLKMIENI